MTSVKALFIMSGFQFIIANVAVFLNDTNLLIFSMGGAMMAFYAAVEISKTKILEKEKQC